jgi:formylglycine-generating enzyme
MFMKYMYNARSVTRLIAPLVCLLCAGESRAEGPVPGADPEEEGPAAPSATVRPHALPTAQLSASSTASVVVAVPSSAVLMAAPRATGGPRRPAAASAVRPNMVRVSGAAFTMGAADVAAAPHEKPPHREVVRSFWMDRTEVTASAYRACVQSGACTAPAHASASCTYDAVAADLPVNCVSFAQAERYCQVIHKRLPREVEWEYAARGTAPARYPWQTTQTNCMYAATLRSEISGRSCTGRYPAVVASLAQNVSVFGVRDMAGNVEEWVADFYAPYTVRSGARSGASHVLRGGSYLLPPSAARTTARSAGSALEAGPSVGFRCAQDDLPL